MPGTQGGGDGKYDPFRDSMMEFVGRTASAIKDIEKDIVEIKDTVKENDKDVYAMCDGKCVEHVKQITESENRLALKIMEVDAKNSGVDARLKVIEQEALVIKTKIGAWAAVASIAMAGILWALGIAYDYFTR